MALPRFSIRTLLLVFTGVAIASLGGPAWAIGMVVAVLSIPLTLAVHAGFYALCMWFARLLGAQEIVARTARGGVERSSQQLVSEVEPSASAIVKALLVWLAVANVVQAQQFEPQAPTRANRRNWGSSQARNLGTRPFRSPGTELVGPSHAPFEMSATMHGPSLIGPVLPTGLSFSAISGVQLQIDSQWPGQFGYRPIVVTARLNSGALEDRDVLIRFSAGDYRSRGQSITVQQSFVIAEGETEASTTLLIPQLMQWQMMSWNVFVDGTRDPDLSLDGIGYPSSVSPGASMFAVTIGLSSSQDRALAQAIEPILAGPTMAVGAMSAGQLPEEWLDYSTIDLVVMPASQIPDLVQRYPRGAAALFRWVRAGGNLWLIRAGDEWEPLALVDESLQLSPLGMTPAVKGLSDADRAIVERGWRFAPLGERAAEPIQGVLTLAGVEAAEPKATTATATSPVVVDPATQPVAKNSQAWFAVRGLGLGLITAFRGEIRLGPQNQPDHLNNLLPAAIAQSMLLPRLSWVMRHGNAPDTFNRDFNNLLIPDVGVAPVGKFQVLITLFVVLIGPLNYWLLKRRNKLPLVLATVPAAALAVTFLLFAYGFLADGLGVRVRARSVTLLDQRAGEAAGWARLSYYAGIAPRDGLAVATDTALYPIQPQWALDRRFGGRGGAPGRELEWGQTQWLRRGWLPSRTPVQLQSVTARKTDKRLVMQASESGLRVTNRLGVDVQQLAVQDYQGRLYWCEDLPAGEEREFKVAPPNTGAMAMRRLFTDHLPEFPPGFDVAQYAGGPTYGVNLAMSLMEAQLEAINSPLLPSWGNGTYIAFTNSGLLVDLGVDDAAEEASFHVIRGNW